MIRRAETGPDDNLPRTLAEVIDHEALAFRAWNTPEGDLLAETVEQLASRVRITKAADPATYRERVEILEQDRDDREYQRGYERGEADGRSAGNRAGIDHLLGVLERGLAHARREDRRAIR